MTFGAKIPIFQSILDILKGFVPCTVKMSGYKYVKRKLKYIMFYI